jgi:hypothetical protein
MNLRHKPFLVLGAAVAALAAGIAAGAVAIALLVHTVG